MICLNNSVGLFDNTCSCLSQNTWTGATTYSSHVLVGYDGKVYQLDPSTSVPYASTTPPNEDANFIDLSSSDSGFLVSDVLNEWAKIFEAQDCFTNGYGLQFLRARTAAIRQFKADLPAHLMKLVRTTRPKFLGRLGETKAKNTATSSNTYQGLLVQPKPLKTAQFCITKVGLRLPTSGPVDVEVYKNGELVQTTTIETVANQYTEVAVQWLLDMYDTGGLIDYQILYSGQDFWDNKLHCGCGGKIAWSDFLHVTGVAVTDPTSVDPAYVKTSNAFGLSVEAEVKCMTDRLICDENNQIDYDGNPLSRMVAKAIQVHIAKEMCENLLASSDINISTLTDKELIAFKRDEYKNEYLDLVKYLAQELSRMPNECFTCADTAITALLV